MTTPETQQIQPSRGLPKTGQIISYRGGDDGDLERGWWKTRLNVNNKTRFILGILNGFNVVMDKATGLMWPRDFTGAGGNGGVVLTWNNAIDWSVAFRVAENWRLPNILELLSIVNYEAGTPAIWPGIFQNVTYDHWSSTTYINLTTSAWVLSFWDGGIFTNAKDMNANVFAVRDFRL